MEDSSPLLLGRIESKPKEEDSEGVGWSGVVIAGEVVSSTLLII
jgi:hypothetical protein